MKGRTPVAIGWALAGITGIGALFRYWHLTSLPPGYWYDEAHKSLVALEILHGLQAPIYVTDGGGLEAGYFWLLAAWFRLFGPGYFASRALSAALGALTVPLTFWAARALYRGSDPGRADRIGLASAGVLSVLLWHVHWSRLGLETITVPLASAALLGLMAWAWDGATWRRFALAGAVLGLSQYTNPGARILPLQAALTFVLLARRPWRAGHRVPSQNVTLSDPWGCIPLAATQHKDRYVLSSERSERRVPPFKDKGEILRASGPQNDMLSVALIHAFAFLAADLLVYAPLGWFFLHNPEWFFSRIAFVSSQARAGGLAFYLDSAAKTLLSLNFRGDALARHNLAGRPALDPLASLWMLGGLAAMLRWPNAWRSHLAALAALGVNLLPMAFSDGAPGFGRTLGATPALVILPAVGIVAAVEWAARRRWAIPVIAGSLLVSAGWSAYDYFGRFPRQPGLFDAFEVGLWRLTRIAAEGSRSGTAYLLLDEAAMQHPTTRLTRELERGDLRIVNAQACLAYPETTASQTTFATLAAWERQVRELFPGATVEPVLHEPEVYEYGAALAVPPGSRSAGASGPALAAFGGKFELVEFSLPPGEMPPGAGFSIHLAWRAVAPDDARYTVFVHLATAEKAVWAGADAEPCQAWYPTLAWKPGEIVEYDMPFTLPADLPPGQYDLAVGVYETATGRRLAVAQEDGREPDRAFVGSVVVQ